MTADALRERHRLRFEWMEGALSATDLTPGEKNVAIRLALHLNLQTLLCNPGHDTLSRGVAMTNSGLRGAISALERKEYIRRARGGHGPRDTTRYTLLKVPNAQRGNGGDPLFAPVAEINRGNVPRTERNTFARGHDESTKVPQKGSPTAEIEATLGTSNLVNSQNIEQNLDKGADGRVRDQKFVVDRIAQLAGLPQDRRKWPKYWQSAVRVVAAWREAYSDEVILVGVERAMAYKRQINPAPPNSIRYFEEPIKQWHKQITTSLPSVVTGMPFATPPAPQELQRRLNELAQRLGWDVLTELSEIEAFDLVGRWMRGEVDSAELHRIAADVRMRAAARLRSPA